MQGWSKACIGHRLPQCLDEVENCTGLQSPLWSRVAALIGKLLESWSDEMGVNVAARMAGMLPRLPWATRILCTLLLARLVQQRLPLPGWVKSSQEALRAHN